MSKLAFLQNITVVADEQPRRVGVSKKEWNPPTGHVIRIWKDGSVFPSEQLVKDFELEYRKRPSEEELDALKAESKPRPFPGNGFDVADSQDFPIFQTGGNRLLIISVAEKDAGRVDMFNTVNCEEDGTPKISVMDQGNTTFGKDFLIPKIEEIYGLTFAKAAIPAKPAVEAKPATDTEKEVKAQPAIPEVPAVEGLEYVDMVLMGKEGEHSEAWALPEGKSVAFFPKIMTKGEGKGQKTTARRENPRMFVFYPKTLLDTPVGVAATNGKDPHNVEV